MTLKTGDKVVSDLFDEIGIIRSMIELNDNTICIVKFGDQAYKLPAEKLIKVEIEKTVEITRKELDEVFVKRFKNTVEELAETFSILNMIDEELPKLFSVMMGKVLSDIKDEMFGEDADA